MKDTSLKRQRDRDLFEVYRKSLIDNVFSSQAEAVEYARLHPAPMFYVSAQCLVSAIGMLLNGKPLSGMNQMSRKRYAELYRRYKEGMSKGTFRNMSRIAICEILVDQPAPEFYIGAEAASDIIYRESKRHNAEMAKRWR